jgi:hypothetical protein
MGKSNTKLLFSQQRSRKTRKANMVLLPKHLASITGMLTVAGLITGSVGQAQSGPIRDRIISQKGAQIVDAAATKMIQKVNSSSCDQLHASMKGSPPTTSPMKDAAMQEFYTILKNNPSLKTSFFNKVSPPLMTKMFDCGMIPPK